MSKLTGYFKVGAATTAEVVLYAASRQRYLYLEGRVSKRRKFRNWARRYPYSPPEYRRPTTEAEIIELVKEEGRTLRVFGSAHSFNNGVVTEDVLVSLDKYKGLVCFDEHTQQMTVRAGTRVREVVQLLNEQNLAFKAMPSHDAQSMGGILSTDVHGTGKEVGFISESVVALKLIDGTGTVHRCTPSDDLFRAAIGGVGALGIISEVTIQGVKRFKVRQKTRIEKFEEVQKDFDKRLAESEHLSLYLFPFADHCQVNTWRPVPQDEKASWLGGPREFLNISADALLAAWAGNLLAYSGLLRKLSRWHSRFSFLVKRGTSLVLESDKAYNRTIYHLHQELEFAIPFDQTFDVCAELLELYKQLYERERLPYALIEVRFTPADHNCTLLGPGRERRSAWIDLIINDSDGFESYYCAAMKVIRKYGGRPHLGKYCDDFNHKDLETLYGNDYRQFLALMVQHDPHGKFVNPFTSRLFPVQRSAAQQAGVPNT